MQRKSAYAATLSAMLVLAGSLISGCPNVPGATGGTGTFNLAPTPIITSDVVRGVLPLTVQFSSDRSTDDGLIVSRQWAFGDAGTSRDISPRHTFTSTGEFVVRLTLTDDQGAEATRTIVIAVTEAPVPVIGVDRTSIESAPAVVNFEGSASFDPDGQIVEYRWDFGDGSREFLQSVQHQYASSGTFRAMLTVTDNTGITATAEVLIQVGIVQPTVEIRVPPPTVTNMVVSQDTPLWIQAVYNVETTADRFIRAGVDGDRDQCQAQTRIVSVASGDTQFTLLGHRDRVTKAAYSADGAFVLTSSFDGTLRLHSATSGATITTYAGVGAITALAFLPDGQSFIYGQANGEIIRRSRSTGVIQRTYIAHTGAVNDLAVSPNGTQMVSGATDRRAIVWNIADGAVLRDFAHPLAVNGVAFNPVNPSILGTGGEDAIVRMWNVNSGAEIATLTGHGEAVNDVVFSPDGTILYSGSDDDRAIAWSVAGRSFLAAFVAHTNDVISVAVTADGTRLVTGGVDATIRIWTLSTGQVSRTVSLCSSPISSVAFSPDGLNILAAISARNDIQLDTSPPNGNDLNITYPQGLVLNRVPSLGEGAVPPGQYFLWAEADTSTTEPVRAYANPVITVTNSYTATVLPATPQISFVNDQATVVPAATGRQIVDLGPLAQGDRLFLSTFRAPGFGESFQIQPTESLMILDSDQKLFAWYQANFILFTQDTKLVVGHSSAHYYMVFDGGVGFNVRVQRATNLFQPRQQRIRVNFAGASAVKAGSEPATNIPVFNAADFNPMWGPAETAIMKQVIIQTLQAKYAGFDVVFSSSDQPGPQTPFLTMHVGGRGTSPALFGISDYIDPRNDILVGQGITFASTLADFALAGGFQNAVSTPTDLAIVIGTIAAHETGHMLGLRHTQNNPVDLMGATTDPTLPLALGIGELRFDEQVRSLPSIGLQDAPLLLAETVGTQ